jgi:hypothetical protein
VGRHGADDRAVGIELDEITTTWESWVTETTVATAKGEIAPGHGAAIRFTINGIYNGEPHICLEHINRVGAATEPESSGHAGPGTMW